MTDKIVVLVTCGSKKEARKIAQALVQRLAIQRGDFGNGVVVRLALLGSNISQAGNGNDDNSGAHRKLRFNFHGLLPATKVL